MVDCSKKKDIFTETPMPIKWVFSIMKIIPYKIMNQITWKKSAPLLAPNSDVLPPPHRRAAAPKPPSPAEAAESLRVTWNHCTAPRNKKARLVFPASFTGTAGAEPFEFYVFKFCSDAAVSDLCFQEGGLTLSLLQLLTSACKDTRGK